MPKQTKICRVCGATYESCRSINTGSSVFNWREVACSPECGMKYLQMVEKARSKKSAVCEPEEVLSEDTVVDGADSFDEQEVESDIVEDLFDDENEDEFDEQDEFDEFEENC